MSHWDYDSNDYSVENIRPGESWGDAQERHEQEDRLERQAQVEILEKTLLENAGDNPDIDFSLEMADDCKTVFVNVTLTVTTGDYFVALKQLREKFAQLTK